MNALQPNPNTARRAFGKKVVPWFVLVGAILLGVSALFFVSITRLISSSGWVAHSYQILDTLDLTEAQFSDAQSAERGFVATCNRAMITPFRSDLPHIYTNLATLRTLTADNPAQLQQVERLHSALSAELSRMTMVMSTTLAGDQKKAATLLADPDDASAVSKILSTISIMEKQERKLLDVRLRNVQYFARMTLGACMSGVVVCGGVLGFVFWLIRRETNRREKSERSLSKSNARLEHSLAELRLYNDSARSIGLLGELLQTCRNTAEALAIVGKHLTQILPDMSGAIGLFNGARDHVEILQTFGDASDFEESFSADDCWGLRRGRFHFCSQHSAEPFCGHLRGHDRNFLCLPMIAQGETLGVASVGIRRETGLTDIERQTIQTIIEQLSLALANLQLQETLRHQSMRDALTGLFNRRYLDDALARETGRARRQGAPLSVVMIDIDHFKRFNDTNGHEGGDALLSEFGQLLSRFVRGEDIPCRYGGEEFAVILPGADREAAVKFAEELRSAIKRMAVRLRDRMLGPVSASLGVACFPDHGKSGQEIIKLADDALYEAKSAGRDRVVAAASPTEYAGEQARTA